MVAALNRDVDAIAKDLDELGVLDEVRAVSRRYGVLLRVVLGPNRHKATTLARDALVALLRERFPHLSYPELGALLRMDHTSVRLAHLRNTKKAPPSR